MLEREEPRSRRPQSPWAKVDSEQRQRKAERERRELRLSHPALLLSVKRKGCRRPFPPPITRGCGARTETAPWKSRCPRTRSGRGLSLAPSEALPWPGPQTRGRSITPPPSLAPSPQAGGTRFSTHRPPFLFLASPALRPGPSNRRAF